MGGRADELAPKDLLLPNERPRPNVPRRGAARPSAPPVPIVPVLLRLRNRGTAPARDVGPDPRPARPSRRPAELKFIFGADFEPVYRGPAPPLAGAPLKFIFGADFELEYRGPAPPLGRPALKFIFGADFEPVYRAPAAPLERPPGVGPAPAPCSPLKRSFGSRVPGRRLAGLARWVPLAVRADPIQALLPR